MAAVRPPLVSWNWAAFVATYAWLRYRGLYAWSWLYLPVSTPLLLAYALVYGNKDGCAAALSPPGVLPPILAAVLAITWIVPPFLAERIAAMRESGTPPRARLRAANAIGLQAIVVVIAFMAAMSSDYETYRMRVAAGMTTLSVAKTMVAEAMESRGNLPSSADVRTAISGRFVSRLDIAADGTLRAVFGDNAERLAGHYVEARPELNGRRIASWSCRTDLPDRCVPASCRTGVAR